MEVYVRISLELGGGFNPTRFQLPYLEVDSVDAGMVIGHESRGYYPVVHLAEISLVTFWVCYGQGSHAWQ